MAWSIEIADGRTEDRWPDYLPTFLDRGALSAIAVPVPAAHLAAALNVYARVGAGLHRRRPDAVGRVRRLRRRPR